MRAQARSQRPPHGPDDLDATVSLDDAVTGVWRASNRESELRRRLVARVVAGCDEVLFAHVPKDRPLVIGRDATCDLVIEHPSVSRRHAMIIPPSPKSELSCVMDLGSRNGTWIRSTRLDAAAPLQVGERFEIGDVTLCIEPLADEELSHLERVIRKVKASGLDPLTGLYSRGWLKAELPQIMEQHAVDGQPLTAVFVDLDHFKSINDTFGHAVGDKVLRIAGNAILSAIRGRDVAIRYGGEEFLLLLKETAAPVGIIVAERVRTAIAGVPWPDHGVVGREVTLCCGVAVRLPEEPETDWFKRADAALYRAKRQGRNRTVVAT
jgi:diguanylate cyclase (GGDEF)-like protein